MNNIKRLLIAGLLVFVFLSLSGVSANNMTDNAEESVEDITSNFTELNQEITNANDSINISKDY